MAPRNGLHPMDAKAFCACADFGSREDPKILLAVLGHRRHRKTPECEQPPYVIDADGELVRAQYPVKTAAEQAAKRDEAAAKRAAAKAAKDEAAPPLSAPSWSANASPSPVQQIPDMPLGAPPALTGKATMPSPDPKAGLPTPAPLFTVTIRIDPGVAQCWDWTLQQGYTSTFEEWISQTIKLAYRELVGLVPMMVPVEAAVA